MDWRWYDSRPGAPEAGSTGLAAPGAGTLASVEDESLDLDMLAASLEADSSDVGMLLRVLADRLSGALGDRLQVERAGGLLKRSKDVRRLTVAVGDDELTAELDQGRLECTVGRRSGGIRIRSEKLAFGDWLRRLLAALQREAAYSQASRLALESIVIGNTDER